MGRGEAEGEVAKMGRGMRGTRRVWELEGGGLKGCWFCGRGMYSGRGENVEGIWSCVW